MCNIPIDTIPPELPTVEVITNCKEITVKWYYPDHATHEDVKYYTLYYRPDLQTPYVLIAIFENPNNCHTQECVFVIDTMSVIIGCFALSVTDSTGNESVLSADTCFDYDICINYLLPNIFTPNGDGVNDFFQPFPYQNIAKIDMTIYHRWGNVVFTTEDPDINWDGTDKLSHQPCAEGVYYYACDLYINALSGTIIKKIHGNVSIKR
jgi:gliding motility-associated-like protein